MEIKIEKNIPVPERKTSGCHSILSKMKVGDSVVIPVTKRGAIFASSRYYGVKVATRVLPEPDHDMMRVWVIEITRNRT